MAQLILGTRFSRIVQLFSPLHHKIAVFLSLLLLSEQVCPMFAFGQSAAASGGSTSTVPVKQDIRPLEKGELIERQITGGEAHSYQVTVKAGQYLHVVVEQLGIDLGVKLFAPDGKQLAFSDSPNGKQGPEPVSMIAEVAGSYRIEVRSLQSAAPLGRYQVKIEDLRTPTPADKDRVAAERAFMEAQQLRSQATAASRRQAIEKYSEALLLFRALGDRVARPQEVRYWEAHTLNGMGVVSWSLGEQQKALEYYHQALSLRRAVGDRFGETNTLNNIGAGYWSLGEQQKALEYYQQALPLRRVLGDRRGEVLTLNNIGLVYWSLDELQKALDYYHQALPLSQQLGDTGGQAYTLNNIGLAYSTLGEQQKALTYYNQALELTQKLGDTDGQAGILNSMGVGYWSLGNLEKALDYYNQALPLVQQGGDRLGVAATLSNIGNVYADKGENHKALDYYNQALLLAQKLGNRSQLAITLSKIGKVYSSLGETQKALDYYNQALSLARIVGNRSREAFTLSSIAALERDRGNLNAALTQIEDALKIIESLRSKIASQELRSSYFASKQDYYKFYIDLLMQLHKTNPSSGYDAQALYASERARARSLLELLSEARADIRSGVNPELLAQEQTLKQQLNAKEQRRVQLLNSQDNEAQAAALQKEIQALLNQYQEVQAQIRVKSPHYAALTQPQPLTLQQIQSTLLDDNTLLLEYSLGKERSYLWAVTKTGITSYELPKGADIEAAAKRFRDALTVPTQRTFPAKVASAATELGNMLLSPVAGQLGDKRLVIVSDGALQYVPFSALRVPGKSGDSNLPLVVEHEIINLPSASTLAVLRRELAGRKPAPKTAAVLADPVFTKDDERLNGVGQASRLPQGERERNSISGELERAASDTGVTFDRLPGTRQEAEQILALLPATEREQAFDFAASRTIATSPDLAQYRIVHFATHGILNSVNPELSGVVLSLVDEHGAPTNGFLRLHDIYNLNLPAELVVLSACQTGLGQDVKGEGLVGLTRGFMYAGAARVVMSLWSVDDQATAKLMQIFYKKMLKEGLKPQAALRAAQVEMSQHPQWSSPYYWAAFTIQGEWR
jgi:CHAT domain-containing protein/tetratricopeptide (TPR) repeat protein